MQVHPHCQRHGKFLVDFYIMHPEDKLFKAPNQRYWLEYHHSLQPDQSTHSQAYHLIKPSAGSKVYAAAKGLQPFCQLIYLTHDDVYIYGPFDFAVVSNGRHSKDRVSLDNWQVLHDRGDIYLMKRQDMICTSSALSIAHENLQVCERVVAAPVLPTICFSDISSRESRPQHHR